MTTTLTKQTWQQALRDVITTPDILWQQLQLPTTLLPAAKRVSQLFPLRVPHSFVQRMQPGDVHDPLLRQVLPLDAESHHAPGFTTDPLHEQHANPVSGILHKYHGRVLLTLTGSCAVHCRYCFRRHFPYDKNNPGRDGWQTVWEYIQQHSDIHEVILSGGDPLMATDMVLTDVINAIADIPHVHTLRLHTRLPIVLPERITDELIYLLTTTRLKCVVVVHCNHPNEIDDNISHVLITLHNAGVQLLNQAVLLKGVNDNAETLIKLSHVLFANHVLPYYLHQLDRVAGTHHFFVPESKGMAIIQECQAKLPGYLVPRYVMEQPGESNKILIQ